MAREYDPMEDLLQGPPIPGQISAEERYLQSLGIGPYRPAPRQNLLGAIATGLGNVPPPPRGTPGFGANFLGGFAQGLSSTHAMAQQRQDEIRRVQNSERLAASHGYRAALLKKLMDPTPEEDAKREAAKERAKLEVKTQFDEANTQLFPLPESVQAAMQRAQGIGPLERKQANVPADKLREISTTYDPTTYSAPLQATQPTPEHNAGIDQIVDRLANTGELPSMGMGGAALRMTAFARLGQKYPGIDLAKTKANYVARSGALKEIVSAQHGVDSFADNMVKNYQNMLDQVAEKDPVTGKWRYTIPNSAPILNKSVRQLANQLGNEKVAAFMAARDLVVPEVARVISAMKISGVGLNEGARKDIDAVVSGDYNLKQLISVYKVILKDTENRKKTYVDEIAKINSLMGPIGADGQLLPRPMRMTGDVPSPTSAAAGRASAAGGMVRVRDSQGVFHLIPREHLDEAINDPEDPVEVAQ